MNLKKWKGRGWRRAVALPETFLPLECRANMDERHRLEEERVIAAQGAWEAEDAFEESGEA